MPHTEPASTLRTVTAPDGVELQYEVIGEGPPVALLHGSFTGRSAFSRQVEPLRPHFRLILISSRGHDGSNGTLPANFGFDGSELEDICAVLDAEGIDQVHLLGHSTGGTTAYALARHLPERVHRMVLIEPTLMRLLPADDYRRVRDEHMAFVETAESSGDAAGMRDLIASMGGDRWRNLEEEKKNKTLDAMRPLFPLLSPHLRNLVDFNVTEEDVRSLKVPTLLIYGEHGPDFELILSRCFASIRPDFPQVHVEGAGHNVHRDKPDIVNAEVVAFLQAGA